SYDAAIGRWMQTDPRAEKYYGMTPYNGLGNNPMLLADPLGDTLKITFRRGFLGLGKKQTVYYNNGNLTDAGGNAYTGKLKGFLGKAVSALNNINTTFSGNSTLSNLSASNFNFTVRRG